MPTREEMGTPIDQAQIDRVSGAFREVAAQPPSVWNRMGQAVRYVLSGVGPQTWMSPGQPLPPQRQDQGGRQFDYPFGVNIQYQPRRESGESGVTFEQLRALSDGYDLLRLAIETRKDQIQSYDWEVIPDNEKTPAIQFQAEIDEVTKFLKRPDGEHDFKTWLRIGVEELLVVDAWCVYPRPTLGGGVYSLDLVDGATIKRIVDEDGRTPVPPDPAYQQIIKGIPISDFHRDELLYLVRNPRVSRIYGMSPVEQVIMTVNIAIRRQLHQMNFYTEGNVPEAIAGVPETWTMEHIKQFQVWWDGMMIGNQQNKRHMKFIPKMDGIVFPKADVIKDEYDEWLARIICYCFSLPPIALIRQVNRASGEQMANTAKEEGLTPWLEWIADQMTYIIQTKMGKPHLRFGWQLKDISDPSTKAQVLTAYVGAQVITVDEAREELGRPALTDEQKAEMGMTAGMEGAVDPATGETVSPAVMEAFRSVAGSPQGAAPSANDPSVDRIAAAFRTTKGQGLSRQPVNVTVHFPKDFVKLGDQYIRVMPPDAPEVVVNNHITEKR